MLIKFLKAHGFFLALLVFIMAAFMWPDLFNGKLTDGSSGRWIPYLVQITMFALGVTLSFGDFARVLTMPKGIFLGVFLQFTIMPLAGWCSAILFQLPYEVATGLILIGCCPSGVTSNVTTFIARGNLPLSISLTACTTMLAPILTPFWMTQLAHRSITVDPWAMAMSIVSMILVPVVVGLLINTFVPKIVRCISRVLPMVAMLSVCLIVAITISLARNELLSVGLALLGASVIHNALGCSFGYMVPRMCGLSPADCRTISLEIGLQNGGMATGLALSVLKSPTAALASAVFGPYSGVAMAMLASFWRHHTVSPTDTDSQMNQANQANESLVQSDEVQRP